jgi:hypothetical protein
MERAALANPGASQYLQLDCKKILQFPLEVAYRILFCK